MKKLLIVIDMQNDFITGALGSIEAEKIVPRVKAKVDEYLKNNNRVVYTRDTHTDRYLHTQEGRMLPIVHCIEGTNGHAITSELDTTDCEVIDKPTFGSLTMANHMKDTIGDVQEIELCGLCSDICVVSNALILKAAFPETRLTVDANCCAGVTVESHKAALLTMKMCQVNVIEEEGDFV